MKLGFFQKFFPVPKYLRMSALGFDVSDQSLKYVELIRKDGTISVKNFGQKIIPQGIIEAGEIKQPEKFVDFLKLVKEELKIEHVITNLPEEKAFVSRVDLPLMEENQIREALELQIEEHIPLPVADTLFDFEIIGKEETEQKKNLEINLIAFPKNIVEGYKMAFEESNILPLAFEMEAHALTRAVVPNGDQSSLLIVDFGKTRTGFVVVNKGLVHFTSTINVSGNAMSNAIAKDFGVDIFQAERIKKEYGFTKTPESEKFFNALLPSIAVVRDEINKHIMFWNSHMAKYGKEEEPIKKIILCGGDSNLNGFSEYLAYQLRIPIELANPWVNVMKFEKHIPEIDLRDALIYSTAIGLALRNLE